MSSEILLDAYDLLLSNLHVVCLFVVFFFALYCIIALQWSSKVVHR